MALRPVVGTGLASCCTVLSGASILFLVLIGIAFERNVEVLTGSTKFEGDGKAVAKNCYAAAIVYACFIAFCGMQIGLNKRHARGAVRI